MFLFRAVTSTRAILHPQLGQVVLAQCKSQNLFSNAFHLVDVTEKEILKAKLLNKDPGAVKKRIIVNLIKTGPKHVPAEDLVKFLLLSEGERDLKFALFVLNKTILEDQRVLGSSERSFDHIWLYLKICYVQNLPLAATQAWTDPVIRATNYTKERARLSRLYFDLLFNNNMFQDVLDTFNKDFDQFITKFDCVKLTCLSCYKLGTKTALQEGLNILAHPSCIIDTPSNRSYQAVALLAYSLKEFSIAYDLLIKYGTTRKNEVDPFFPKTLMLLVLADLGWLEEAVLLLESSWLVRDGSKKKFSYFAVEKVLDVARESGDKEAENKIMKMRLLPPSYAYFPEAGLEQMLLKEIKPSVKHRQSPQTPFTFSI
eukprot:GFUD01020412.1.p1 GENE.GFUD01020412.1~~GFUD01020412.1.p1  ORF type:complete len:371 (-),score=103.45 GFUD01020412.1:35-1147(-)